MKKKLTTAQVKVGDYLVNVDDAGAVKERHRVKEVIREGGRRFRLEGHWSSLPSTGKQLTAWKLNYVERDGVILGYFFVPYW